MRPPLRQTQVAWYIVKNPEHLHKPSEIARKIGCEREKVNLALNKIAKKVGQINPERLCPSCITNSRFNGCCGNCGIEITTPNSTFQTFQTLPTHEILNKIYESAVPRSPIPIGISTADFLKGGRRDRMKQFLLSRLEQLLKRYMPKHFVTNQAALILERQLQLCVSSSDLKRITGEHRLAIMVQTLMESDRQMPL